MGRNKLKNLDNIGWLILNELLQSPRLSYREISRRVNMSCSSVLERIRRMEDVGIIKGYRLVIDEHKIGHTIQAIIRVKFYSLDGENLLFLKLQSNTNVQQFWVTTGDCDFIIEASFPSMNVMNHFLTLLGKYGRTQSSVIISKPIFNRKIQPPMETP